MQGRGVGETGVEAGRGCSRGTAGEQALQGASGHMLDPARVRMDHLGSGKAPAHCNLQSLCVVIMLPL